MEPLKKAMLEKTFESDGKIKLTCSDAYAIAEKFDVRPSAIGKICNEENIRISKCQLKCF